MEETQKHFLPAAGHHWALPLYDPFMKLLGGDATKEVLIRQANLQPAHRVLDIGCGTGTLAVLIKRLHPAVTVMGLDPDPQALARASKKAARASASVQFEQGFADALPYPDASFDRVFSSFMFHHLEAETKEKALREVRRVLKPGGSLHLLDFGGPKKDSRGILARLFHSHHRLKDNFDDGIIAFMRRAGLAAPKELSHRATLFGPIAYYEAGAATAELSIA